jgi:4-amino-4-deoxy-L-arabinose transferase-like glycosyltransferase
VLSFVAVTKLSEQRLLRWAVLLGVLVVFILLLVRLHPANFFGLTEDDGIYFSSAKVLAEGKGYILPGLPGTPAQHKYPILYPWLLSWVWRWNPSFPANLKDAIALTAVFGAGFIVLMYLFLRKLRGLNEAEALGLTAFCALGPHVLFYSGSVLTDIPFACLALAALVVGDCAMRREARPGRVVASGLLAGLAMLVRVLGVPVAAGIFLAGATRRTWRQVGIFCASVLPFFVLLVWNATFSGSAAAPAMGAVKTNAAWQMQWAYYTSYLAFWKLTVWNNHIFWPMLKDNAAALVIAPATFFIFPLLGFRNPVGAGVWTLISVGIVAGIVRQARRQEWKPIHWALPICMALALVWNFSQGDRYLLAFLPLFAAGLWLEGKHAFGMVRAALVEKRAASEKIIAVGLGLGLAALAGAIAWNYAGGARSMLFHRTRERAALLQEKREAYDWLRRHSPADARIIADEDANLYLYTGRQAARLAIFSAEGIFKPEWFQEQLARVVDVPRAIGARYWMVSDDDFSAVPLGGKFRSREQQLEAVLPLVFSSRDAHVRIYSLGCVNHPEDPACRAADGVLFPSGRRDANAEIR